ncbi:hypothetical protein DdX_17907 [Ditylenchus destructor]|uniref:Uncharacterized protein n=1 Tax=Ditylenchus destructor TaxID=166010 RepID=A0AAD4MQJ0_9BILA|nr:hypothetical protein DdX_17907 [Ditylenchus destructor]
MRQQQQLIKASADAIALEAIFQLQSRLTDEGTKIESHMKFIHELLSEAQVFFDKLAAFSGKKSRKPSPKLAIGKSDEAQYSQMDKFDGVINPAAKFDSRTLLTSLKGALEHIPE